MSHYTELPITLKTGAVLPKGCTVMAWNHKDRPTLMKIMGPNGTEYTVRVRSGFKAPSMKTLNKWMMDSMCESVLGYTVEHDGMDEHGSPSWMMALGLI